MGVVEKVYCFSRGTFSGEGESAIPVPDLETATLFRTPNCYLRLFAWLSGMPTNHTFRVAARSRRCGSLIAFWNHHDIMNVEQQAGRADVLPVP